MRARMGLVIGCLAVALLATNAEAQWVMVAKAVSGRVQRMNNQKNGVGYDVATVVLEASADKVYETAVKHLSSRPDLVVTQKNAATRTVDFAKGEQIASMQATPLGEKITQLVIASSLTGEQPSSTSLVVQGVMRVCKEMNVECTLSGQ
jgi:hypothetical protein